MTSLARHTARATGSSHCHTPDRRLLSAVRHLPGCAPPETRVRFMSGYTDEDVLQRGLVGEHRAFIQKPFAIEDVTRMVHDVLRPAV